MPFNPDKHASLPYIDIPYRRMLDKLVKKHKRAVKSELEHIIEQAAKGTDK